jgi:hypothetical protein
VALLVEVPRADNQIRSSSHRSDRFHSKAGNPRHEDVRRSLELFAREVMPEFHERHAKQEDWKRRVISGEIKIAPVDVTPYNTAKEQSVEARLGIAN